MCGRSHPAAMGDGAASEGRHRNRLLLGVHYLEFGEMWREIRQSPV